MKIGKLLKENVFKLEKDISSEKTEIKDNTGKHFISNVEFGIVNDWLRDIEDVNFLFSNNLITYQEFKNVSLESKNNFIFCQRKIESSECDMIFFIWVPDYYTPIYHAFALQKDFFLQRLKRVIFDNKICAVGLIAILMKHSMSQCSGLLSEDITISKIKTEIRKTKINRI